MAGKKKRILLNCAYVLDFHLISFGKLDRYLLILYPLLNFLLKLQFNVVFLPENQISHNRLPIFLHLSAQFLYKISNFEENCYKFILNFKWRFGLLVKWKRLQMSIDSIGNTIASYRRLVVLIFASSLFIYTFNVKFLSYCKSN